MTGSDHEVQIGTTPAPDSYWIEVSHNGPYIVHGAPPVTQATIGTDAQGNSQDFVAGQSFPAKQTMALCRCGHSKNAPFCDSSHLTAGMDLTERASFAPLLQGAEEIDGPRLALTDNEKYCAFGRFCDVGQGGVWNEVQLPGESHEKLTTHVSSHCPGGRLMAWDRTTGQPIEPAESASIHLIEDPAQGCSGPLMVRGGIRVQSGSGQSYEVRNRQALCRCGHSRNKPFCDGSHASVGYQDGIA